MTDFDQLIKEKLEQKEYPYSASSWHRFAQKAGLKSALTVTQSVIIAVASVAIVAVGSWFGIRHFSSMEPAATATSQQMPVEEPVLLAADTTMVEEVSEEPNETEAIPTSGRKPVSANASADVSNNASADTATEKKPVREPILRPKNPRRILEIDPDTIKSNE